MNYTDYIKSQVTARDWETLQQLRVNLDSKAAARLWPEAVNLEKRAQREVPFLLSHLQEYPSPKIFDACLGSGATSIGLKKAGIENIISNEVDAEFQKVALDEAAQRGIQLDIVAYDWRELAQHYQGEFDAVLCLGNSLTYLFRGRDQRKVLENFRAMLKPEGKLIIDERNYTSILEGKFKHSGEIVYCGKEKVSIQPIYTSESMVVLEYLHRQRGEKAHLVVYPFEQGELYQLLKFYRFKDIWLFSDYQSGAPPRPYDIEFLTYVAKR